MTRQFNTLYNSLINELHIRRRNPNQMDGMSGKYNRKSSNVNRNMVSKRDKKKNTVKGKLKSKMAKLRKGKTIVLSPKEKASLSAGKRTLKGSGAINSKTPNLKLKGNRITKI